jgi:Ca-activated chloride channel homolog
MPQFNFQYQYFIWLFVAIPFFILLFLALLQWKKKVKKKMGDARLINALTAGFAPGLFLTRFIVLSVGFAVGIIAAMNPRKPGGADNVTRKGIDVVIAIDVSKSMLATDLSPNRLERARQFVSKLMAAMPNDRIGLVFFAGSAYLQMPLTSDHGAAQLFVASASPDAVPQQGTVISDALDMSVNAFNPKEKRFKAIVLISDGEEHDGQAIAKAAEFADMGVMINTVGVGSPEGATLIEPTTGQPKLDELGNPVVSKLNEETLKQISEATNGVYVRLQGSDEAVETIQKQLSQIESKAFTDVSLLNYKTFFMWFAGAMFVLLMAENFIPERKQKK